MADLVPPTRFRADGETDVRSLRAILQRTRKNDCICGNNAITNTGITPLRVPFAFFHWQLPGQKNASVMINPLDAYATDRWVAQRTYPVEISPKATEYFMLSDLPTFQEMLKEMINQQSRLKRMLYRFVRVTILTDDGTRFRAKIGKEVRNEIASIITRRKR